jgi:arsenate reductase (thioredoxin)
MDKKKVLFVCVHNSGRSQMAEAFFNQLGGLKVIAFSAGTQPADQIDPIAAYVMREAGLDISRQTPKMLTMEMMENADRVISMGCGIQESCPAGLVPMEDWGIEDPAGKPVRKVREIRDIIRKKVETLIKELNFEVPLELKGGEK